MDPLAQAALLEAGLGPMVKILLPIIGIFVGLLILSHFVNGWLLSRIAKKHNYPSPWLAYVPIAQFSVLFSLGGINPKHIFWIFVPVFGFFAFAYFWIKATINLCTNNGESPHFIWVLASPFVKYWGLYRLGKPGNIAPEDPTETALISTAKGLIENGRTEGEISAMMMQVGLDTQKIRLLYSKALYQIENKEMTSVVSNLKPLKGIIIVGLFILGFILQSIAMTPLNSIIKTIMEKKFGNITENFGEDFLDEESFGGFLEENINLEKRLQDVKEGLQQPIIEKNEGLFEDLEPLQLEDFKSSFDKEAKKDTTSSGPKPSGPRPSPRPAPQS